MHVLIVSLILLAADLAIPVDFGPLSPEPVTAFDLSGLCPEPIPPVDFAALTPAPRLIVSTVAPKQVDRFVEIGKSVQDAGYRNDPAFPARTFQPPIAPAAPPARAVYRLVDSAGTTWTHPNPGYLRDWVAARNAALARAATSGFVLVPGRLVTFPTRLSGSVGRGATCTSGNCPR